MTVKELSQFYWLKKEIDADQQRLEELEQMVGAPTQPQLTGMPHAPNRNESKVERLAAEIVDLQAIIAARRIQCIHERAHLERWINAIPDSLTRQVFLLRFAGGLSWVDVADRMTAAHKRDFTEYAVKKRCYRYLKSTENEKV